MSLTRTVCPLIAVVVLWTGPALAQLSGSYDLGGGNNDFSSFSDAVAALNQQGINGPVIFDCYAGTYNEHIRLTPITGTSSTDRVTFQRHLGDVVTLASSADTAVVAIDSCDFVTFDGINTTSTGTSNVGYYVAHDANGVTIRNAVVAGRDSTVIAVRGIVVSRDGCDSVTIDGCTISNAYYGVMMFVGGSSNESADLEIMHCSISGANYCVFLDNSPRARCHDNHLQPKGADAVDAQGVLVESQTAGDTVYVYNNRIFNLRRYSRTTSANLSGIQVRPGTATGAAAYIYNNFVYGYTDVDPRQHGVMNGILCGGGVIHLYHNSILMNDQENDSLGVIAAINVNSSSSNVTALNNILVSTEDDTAYGIRRANGTLSGSNYNCFYGTGADFRVGRNATTDYATLADWQGLGYDANSLSGDPGFVSATDLHINSAVTLVDSMGTYLTDVPLDIDGDLRNDPPDMGADEFVAGVAPDAVTDLTVYRVAESDDMTLRWSATANANSYLIYSGDTPDFVIEPAAQIGVTAATTFTHTGTVPASARQFYVVIASTAPAR